MQEGELKLVSSWIVPLVHHVTKHMQPWDLPGNPCALECIVHMLWYEKQSNTPDCDGSVEGGGAGYQIPVTKSIISDTCSEYFFKNKIT